MSSGDRVKAAAHKFSSRCSIDWVPGIGSIARERCSTQANATCTGVTPCRSAIRPIFDERTPRPPPSGYQGRKAMPMRSQACRTSSLARLRRLYSFWTETIGAICRACSSCATVTFETPRWRIFPDRCSAASAPIGSVKGTSGSGASNWYRSTRSMRRRDKLPSSARRKCSGRPSSTQVRRVSRSRPPLVAMTRPGRRSPRRR